MADHESSNGVDRRRFLTGVALASAVGPATAFESARAQSSAPAPGAGEAAPLVVVPAPRGAQPPSNAQHAAEFGTPAQMPPGSGATCGSDFMVDVLKSVGIDYVFANTASSFRALQESVVNYARDQTPEFITCMHEESSVGMAHGYAKASGKPAAMFCHGTVGMQHASMAMYNAWCDRVPLLAFLGNTADSVQRTNSTDWRHSAQDPAAIVRDFTKWDDQPSSLQGFAESVVRGYKLATTPPMEPVAIVADSELQEMELPERGTLSIPKLAMSSPPTGDSGALREAATYLVKAQRPVIVADRVARTPEGMRLLVELAETLCVPVVDQASRQNFPTSHYLCQSAQASRLIREADLVLGLEVTDFWGLVNQHVAHRAGAPRNRPDAKLITLCVNDLYLKSNYQDFQRYAAVDLSINGDAEASLPGLIEAVRTCMTTDGQAPAGLSSVIAAREAAFRQRHAKDHEEARVAASYGWDASPVSTSRLCMELWQAVRNEDWSLVSVGASPMFVSNWPHRLWRIDRHYQYLGVSAGGGVGYGLPAAVGAALANKKLGRFSVNIQCDGDFMYANGALWTAAHHRIPLLTVMHNNRAYGQETMLVQVIANRRNRGVDRARIGTAIDDPPIDYAKLAQSMGVYAEGPISDPKDLAPALQRAVRIVKSGSPALVDVVTQLR
jgi:thiamine pyrophosphate-dependent acetolactate synthase large subunit-like protein